MKTIHHPVSFRRLASGGAAITAAALVLGACAMNTQPPPGEGIGYRQARFEEISAMQSWRKCRDDALALDTQARESGDPARYIASARLIEKCEAELGPDSAQVGTEERMRAYALGIQNYVKGGEVDHAAANLDTFEKSFAGKDLYLADGSSFVETMRALFGQKQDYQFGQYALLNVGEPLKAEMRRVRYWKHN